MIGKLTGTVDCVESDSIVLDVAGVGYLVHCATKILNSLIIGQKYSLYIETYVREDMIKLFGFLTLAEKQIFLLLQSVNGVGAKMALSILSCVDLEKLRQAILDRDKNLLLSVPGVGAKIAERIIVELKNNKTLAAASLAGGDLVISEGGSSSKAQDAIMGLVFLGISKAEASSYVERVLANDLEMPIDDIIKQALILRNRL
jgi:Holliday junction DNA helicase RuvA